MGAFQRATAWVSPRAVEHNCRRLGAELGAGTELCAVVKADGYGHGMIRCAKAAIAGGATQLAVATAGEAFELHESLGETPILIMGALTEAELDAGLGARAEISVWRQGFLELVAGRAAAFGQKPRIHVKFDTGMGRLGEREPANVERLLAAAAADDRVELAGLWTHFATADEDDDSYLQLQLERFLELAEPARERYGLRLHAANSAATLREPRSHFDMVRCGVAIYGLDPFGRSSAEQGLDPAMGLSSYIADIKRFEAGESVGYGRRWTAPRETFVAVVPVGYGDGVRRALSNNCEVLIAGRRHPLVGTVSMDNIAVDLGSAPEAGAGEEVVLLGSSGDEAVRVEEWAERLGTISYEITCAISSRVPRIELR